MSKWIDKDDEWGIRQALKEIYSGTNKKGKVRKIEDIFLFNVWLNQFIPPPYYETVSTVIRHIDEIKAINFYGIWIERKGSFQTVNEFNKLLEWQLKEGMLRLPTYYEIQEELQRIQANPMYEKEKGITSPIKEEFVQLVIKKK